LYIPARAEARSRKRYFGACYLESPRRETFMTKSSLLVPLPAAATCRRQGFSRSFALFRRGCGRTSDNNVTPRPEPAGHLFFFIFLEPENVSS